MNRLPVRRKSLQIYKDWVPDFTAWKVRALHGWKISKGGAFLYLSTNLLTGVEEPQPPGSGPI